MELVLVGGGHAHVEVLRRWARDPVAGVRGTVVVDRSDAVYSGMVPGVVAGQYAPAAAVIDVAALARAAGMRCVAEAMAGVDADAHHVRLAGGGVVPYDVASFDVGSTVAGLDVPGARAHALATRPIGRFVEAVASLAARDVVVAGGGAAGVELAFALGARLRGARVVVLERGDRLLPGLPERAVRLATRAAAGRGIVLRTGVAVARVEADRVVTAAGDAIAADGVVWATGAAALRVFADSGLACDGDGFVRVDATLAAVGRPEVFAAGDCAALDAYPRLAKAGVYAVREAPVLDHNLRARLAGRPLRPYVPQRDFLVLLNLADGTAIGAKWGLAARGRWLWTLKDRIDRGFVARYAVPLGAASC